ncbi:MAG: hypothetical protein GVY19_05140 [Bacteroidetes bacterium]|nr:hypothetical protein [Bacteroidota bacterium]
MKYISILVISLLAGAGYSQEAPTDTATYLVFTPGIDIAQFAQPYINDGYSGVAASLDVEFVPNILFVAEYGINNYNIEKERYKYSSGGSFYKAGFDINVLRNNQQKNQVTLGFRYAYSRMEHELEELTVISYWGENFTYLAPEKVQSHWLEFSAGIRMQLISNLYLGWSLRARLKESNVNESYLPLYIPGYNKNRDNVVFGFTYSVYYKFFRERND